MRYEDGVYSVGLKDELIKYHNEWVENSGRFELDEIDDNLATTLQDLDAVSYTHLTLPTTPYV